MKRIQVTASRNYEVLVGRGLLQELGAHIKNLTKAEKIAIVSDSNVWPLYGSKAVESLKKAGFGNIISYVFPAGEESKCGETYLALLNHLAENKLTRSDCLVALGGGVVGDMTGFVAATYLRGIDYIQIPTTVLAAVDSSVGGKTAVDLPTGKNLLGAFYQPHIVLIDPETLSTLPREVYLDGMAEVIKYAAIMDEEMYPLFDDFNGNIDTIVARCVKNKRCIVDQDERDTGLRQLLNYGHTFGHAIELLNNFQLGHGHCVSIGMAIMSRACVKKGMCAPECATKLISTLERAGLPTSTELTAEQIYEAMLSDKKRMGSTITLVVPSAPGTCILHKVPVEDALDFIRSGLN